MKRITRQIPIAFYAFCTSIFSSYTGESDIFILTLGIFIMGKMLKQILDESGETLNYFSFYAIGAIILNFAYFTVIACYNTQPIFALCALLSLISGYTLQSIRYPKE